MQIRFGCEFHVECDHATPAVLLLTVRPERRRFLLNEDAVEIYGATPPETFIDSFGNFATRAMLPAGRRATIRVDGLVLDSGRPDPVAADARATPIEALPPTVLPFLMSSRYCEVDLLTDFAWAVFGGTPPGWPRVQAICDFVHRHIAFGYAHARATRTAAQALEERVGVCRDFAHLAVALCRAMGMPARYTTGYLGDIGVPASPSPMDFSAWFEVWLDRQWFAFDARHNTPRIGRIPLACGRDAADAAFFTTFGTHRILDFRVWTDAVDTSLALPVRMRRQGGVARSAAGTGAVDAA